MGEQRTTTRPTVTLKKKKSNMGVLGGGAGWGSFPPLPVGPSQLNWSKGGLVVSGGVVSVGYPKASDKGGPVKNH